MAEDIEKRLNKTINWYDPPKDLAIGGHLTNDVHGERISKAMTKLFGTYKLGSVTIPDKTTWHPVGKSIAKLTSDINILYKESLNKQNIIREKHSSGTSTRPSDLFVMQDNGPVDVVSNPNFIITPGSILDPAGKTKSNAIYLTRGLASTLDKSITDKLGFETCITGDITIVVPGAQGVAGGPAGRYTITIPTMMNLIAGGIIKGVFNTDTFKPIVEESQSVYFQGNEIKNNLIKNQFDAPPNDNSLQIIMAHILMKELGDTLQVAWLNKLYTLEIPQLITSIDTTKGRAYNFVEKLSQVNSVIITSDAIVQYRSIVNSIPVIFTEKSKTTYISPASGANVALLNQAFIKTLIKDLHTHNNSVIETFTQVKAEGSAKSLEQGAGKLWLGNTWTLAQIQEAIKILNIIINILKSFVNDTQAKLYPLTDVEAAKAIISQSFFISPFVKKAGEFKKITSVIYLLPNNKIKFTTNAFLPSRIETPGSIIDTGKRSGGAYISQEGGMLNLEQIGIIQAAVLAAAAGGGAGGAGGGAGVDIPQAARTVIDELSKTLNKNIVLYNTAGTPDIELLHTVTSYIKHPEAFDLASVDYVSDIERVNIIDNPTIDLLINILYCLVKEFHPEIFTYARFMAASLVTPTADDTALLAEDFLSYFNGEDDYKWGDDNKFKNYTGTGDSAHRKTITSATIRAIRLAKKFIDTYPAFNSKGLNSFINVCRGHIPILAGAEPDMTLKQEAQEGGGDEEDLAADVAIDLYEPYYSLLLRKNYNDTITLDSMIYERLEFILPFDQTIPDEFKGDLDYKHSREKVLNVFIEDLKTLPLVVKYLPEAMAAVKKYYSKHDVSTIHSMSIIDLISKISMNKQTLKPMTTHLREISIHAGGKFSKLRITRKTRRSNLRNRSTRVIRKRQKAKNKN